MKVSQMIYDACIKEWESCCHHPFIQGMADGTLDHKKFQYYMIQDHKYLMQYAKVFALGVIKCESEEDMRLYGDLIKATLDTENAVHQAYLKELGITKETIEEAPVSLNNKSYTDYMIAEAFKGGMPELTASVLSCSWSYKFIGDYLETLPHAFDHPFYRRWIEMYTSEGYRKANDLMIDLVDRYCEGLSAKRLEHIKDIVKTCSDYEYQFWDAAWTMGESYTPVFK